LKKADMPTAMLGAEKSNKPLQLFQNLSFGVTASF
jgi:hypothetical protein